MSKLPNPETSKIGVYGGLCNRRACRSPGAEWYNHSTRAYYCTGCASVMNSLHREEARRLYSHDLCTKGAFGASRISRSPRAEVDIEWTLISTEHETAQVRDVWLDCGDTMMGGRLGFVVLYCGKTVQFEVSISWPFEGKQRDRVALEVVEALERQRWMIKGQ